MYGSLVATVFQSEHFSVTPLPLMKTLTLCFFIKRVIVSVNANNGHDKPKLIVSVFCCSKAVPAEMRGEA